MLHGDNINSSLHNIYIWKREKTGQGLSAVSFIYPQGFGYHGCLGLEPKGDSKLFPEAFWSTGRPLACQNRSKSKVKETSFHHDEPHVKRPTNVLLLVFAKPWPNDTEKVQVISFLHVYKTRALNNFLML